MIQGIQERFEDNEKILKYGCYFLCLAELGNRINKAAGKYDFEEEGEEAVMYDVNIQYACYVGNGAMKSDCTILDPAFILGDLTGKKYRFSRTITQPQYPYYIIENVKPGYTHFTLCYDGALWDPLDPARPAAKQYKPRSYRLLEVV
jgi:hypothetical protein